jgi:hypothetical protein
MDTNEGAKMNTNPNSTHFTPSSNDLLAMIANAEAKFAGDREQAQLKSDARASERMERAISSEVFQRNRNFR